MHWLTNVRVSEMINRLEEIPGVRVFDEDSSQGKFSVGMVLPDERCELTACVDVYDECSYFHERGVPLVTPPSYLLVNAVLAKYDLQPINVEN